MKEAPGRTAAIAACLRGEDDFVDLALGGAEAAADREGAGDVRGVAGQLRSRRRSAPANGRRAACCFRRSAGCRRWRRRRRSACRHGRRRRVGGIRSSVRLRVRIRPFPAAGAHGAGVASRSDVCGAAHEVDLVRVLGQPHLRRAGPQIADFARRALAAAALGAHGIQRVGDAAVPVGVVAERVPERAAVGDQVGQLLFETGNRIGFGEAEGLGGGFGAVAEAVPDLALLVLFAAEEDRFRFLPPTERSPLRVRESR
jgi:hypothetical protein